MIFAFTLAWNKERKCSNANKVASNPFTYHSDMLIILLAIMKKLSTEDVWAKDQASQSLIQLTTLPAQTICSKIELRLCRTMSQMKLAKYSRSRDHDQQFTIQSST